MTDNEKLARFQGWQNDATLGWCSPIGKSGSWFVKVDVPDYLNDDAAAMSLLDTLVEKGYIWSLYGKQAGCLCKVYKMPDVVSVVIQEGNARREAIVAAVLELIEKEDV